MPIHRALTLLMLAAVPLAGCTDRQGGLLPVAGDEGGAVRQERFIKRLHLDLTGELPGDPEITAALAELEEESGPAARGAMADARMADRRFAEVFVLELENRVFGGGNAQDTYALFCPALQAIDPACAACEPTLDCSGCACPVLASLAEEREGLLAAADDLAAGRATSSDIERRYAESQIFVFNGGAVESVAGGLFVNFLGRPPEADETKHASAMIFGTFVPGSPVGLLFHRLGENYADLIDIVFTSEVYRDAAVDGVFLRYLGRNATPEELSHFAGGLDPASPDVRPVIRAVVSSGEYFSQ